MPAPLTYRPIGGSALAEHVLRDTGYEHDPVGNVVALHERAVGSGAHPATDGLDREFAYDAVYRLLSATGRECGTAPADAPWSDGPRCEDPTAARRYTETYTYDDAGNLATIGHRAGGTTVRRTFVPAPGSDRLDRLEVGTTSVTYAYDHHGNVSREALSRHFEWDHADRLRVYRTQTEGAEPSVHTTYLYDSSGRRVKRLVRKAAGIWEATTYVEHAFESHRRVRPGETLQNDVLSVGNGDARILQRRVGPAFTDDGAADAPVTYTLSDHVNSAEITIGGATPAERRFVRREEFTPYGETAFGGYGRKRYRYTGKERDDASGLYDHGARLYAPWLGRWTSCDPTISLDALNRYAYARDSPLVFRDPDGRRDSATKAAGEVLERAVPRLVSRAGAGAGGGAGAGAGIGAGIAAGAIVTGALALWTRFTLEVIARGGERAEERVRRAAQAQNLREEGLITAEEANQYIITGQLFLPRERGRDRTLEDAYREKWFELGHQFQQHVLDTVLRRLYRPEELEVEFSVGTTTGPRRPDFARWDPRVPGQFEWVGDAKLGRITLDDQMRGLIDEAARTTTKTLYLFTPEGVSVPRSVIDAAKTSGVSVVQIQVPFMPDYIPKVDGKAKPRPAPAVGR